MSTALLVHSGGFTSRQWRKLAASLSTNHRVLTPDLLGYVTPWPVGAPFHFREDVAMLRALLDEPAHVIGHSYGGFLALQLALAHPELVRSISVYEPVAFGILDEKDDEGALASLAEIKGYVADVNGVDEAWLTSFVDWWSGQGTWQHLPIDTRQAFRNVGWKLSQEVSSLAADRTGRAGYSKIVAPTLLLGGERSPAAERRVLAKLARALPHATLQMFAGLGHMGPITHPAEINPAIVAHVEINE
jgi:pimeloyl-ACP methyl ester carboxylesterase